jgi:hypothetical protein
VQGLIPPGEIDSHGRGSASPGGEETGARHHRHTDLAGQILGKDPVADPAGAGVFAFLPVDLLETTNY